MAMTLREIELACRDGHAPQFHHHAIEASPPKRKRLFHPFGFPVEVRCDTEGVLQLYEEMWGMFQPQFSSTPLRCEVFVHASGDRRCPPAPTFRIQRSLLITVADVNNYSVVNLATGLSRVTVSHAALRHPQYAMYFLLSAPLSALASRCATPVHAACVSFAGKGVLLCGDSGAGKSTLAYACARRGWQYTSDDSSFLVTDDPSPTVAGDCYHVRFRPESAILFPEISTLTPMPRATGKPSVQMNTRGHTSLTVAPIARIEHVVFLDRTDTNEASLAPYCRTAAQAYMRQSLIGTRSQKRRHVTAIEQLLGAAALKLRYNNLGRAVDRLERLVLEGADERALAFN